MSEIEEYAKGLIELGEFIVLHQGLFLGRSFYRPEAEPRLEVPDPVAINVSCVNADDLAEKLKALGSGEKYSDVHQWGSYTGVKKNFGPHVIDVFSNSDRVCTPKRRETRSVPKVQLTDEARAQIDAIRAAHTVMETTEVVTEWSCPPSLLSPSREASS